MLFALQEIIRVGEGTCPPRQPGYRTILTLNIHDREEERVNGPGEQKLSTDEVRLLEELYQYQPLPLHVSSLAVLLGWSRKRVLETLVHLQAVGQVWGRQDAAGVQGLMWAPLVCFSHNERE